MYAPPRRISISSFAMDIFPRLLQRCAIIVSYWLDIYKILTVMVLSGLPSLRRHGRTGVQHRIVNNYYHAASSTAAKDICRQPQRVGSLQGRLAFFSLLGSYKDGFMTITEICSEGVWLIFGSLVSQQHIRPPFKRVHLQLMRMEYRLWSAQQPFCKEKWQPSYLLGQPCSYRLISQRPLQRTLLPKGAQLRRVDS